MRLQLEGKDQANENKAELGDLISRQQEPLRRGEKGTRTKRANKRQSAERWPRDESSRNFNHRQRGEMRFWEEKSVEEYFHDLHFSA